MRDAFVIEAAKNYEDVRSKGCHPTVAMRSALETALKEAIAALRDNSCACSENCDAHLDIVCCHWQAAEALKKLVR